MTKKTTQKNRGGYLKNPKLPRDGEVIGGGYFVFRRGDGTKRIRPSMWPFEYDSEEAARKQAEIHAKEQPGFRFDVMKVVDSVIHLEDVADAA